MSTRYFLSLLLIISSGLSAQPIINSIISNNDTLYTYDKFEISVDFTASFHNPYNPEEIELSGFFVSPAGDTMKIAGFYYQEFQEPKPDSVVPIGSPTWRIRFTPATHGTWEYSVEVKDSSGTASSGLKTFLCQYAVRPGFLRIDSGNTYFNNEFNEFVVIGENLCWGQAEQNYSMFYEWIDNLAANGSNFIKVIMAPWAFELEWQDSSLGDYSSRQAAAWSLDGILDYAHSRGIYTQLDFVIHGEYKVGASWEQNPYNASNGGPCVAPQDFFTDGTASSFFNKKLQYIVGRWGFHPGIAAWEIISEADRVGDYEQNKQEVREWILDKAAWLKAHDPWKHPVTAGFALSESDTLVWESDHIDFTQTHIYDDIPDLEMRIYANNLDYRKRFGKPVINGEFGLYYNPDSSIAKDPDGIAFHNVLWASSMSESLGTGLSWWWDTYIHPQNLYYHLGGLSSFMNIKSSFNLENYDAVRSKCITTETLDETIIPGFRVSLEKAPTSHFTLEQSGLLTPGTAGMGSTLYGSGIFVFQFQNPPHIEVDYFEDGYFEVRTGGTVLSSSLKITIDSIVLLDTPALPDSSYRVAVSAGKHIIKIENSSTSNAFMEIKHYRFIHHSPVVRALSMQRYSKDSIVSQTGYGWIHHRKYNWYEVLYNGTPSLVSNAQIKLPTPSNDKMKIAFYDTHTGGLISEYDFTPVADSTLIDLPDFNTDMAYILWITAGTEEGMRKEELSLNVHPNPVGESTTISLQIIDKGHLSIKIYDIMGKLLCILMDDDVAVGNIEIQWDGKNMNGSDVKPGMYIVVAEDGRKQYSQKLLKY